MRFADRVALVTGASRGVGKALALRLAAEGCDVVVAAKTVAPDAKLPGTIHETAREIEALGRRALAAQLDVRDDAAVERVVAEALARWGRIDFLVNNAAALYWRPVADTDMKRFDLVMSVNVRGVRFQRCGMETLAPSQGGQAQATEDFGSQGSISLTNLDESNIQDMGIQVYVDGHRMTGLFTSVDDVLKAADAAWGRE